MATATNKTGFEVALEMVEKSIKGTKIVSQDAKTGTSFFQGKKRLCKILNTKRGISIEVNVALDKELEKEFNIERISHATAYKKHLGTMKYMAHIDEKVLPKFTKSIIDAFKAEVAAEEKANKEPETKAN